ncbi:MAG: alpha/beta hydrolase [Hyphomicrobiaceae bacterium]
MGATTNISGVELEITERGAGPALLFLHDGEGLRPDRPWLERLARRHHVIAPSHPGYGGSALPEWIGSVDDLAYLYLDLADKLQLKDAVLVGCSLGGWIAAEMLVRSTAHFSRAVLASPLGIKVSARDVADIADMHAMSRKEYLEHAYAVPENGAVDTTTMSEAELRSYVSGREALCLYGWRPYMHNPRLRRWLHRIDKPTLLIWGGADRILSADYRQGWGASLSHETSVTLPDAGHYPHLEQPDAFAELIEGEG